jgi:hypothetical protein
MALDPSGLRGRKLNPFNRWQVALATTWVNGYRRLQILTAKYILHIHNKTVFIQMKGTP